MTIAEKVRAIMISRHEVYIWIGTVELLDVCAMAIGKGNLHPIIRNRQILNALENSAHFRKGIITIEINSKLRKVRCFRLLE